MRKVAYIGLKATKSDNVAGTGLTWERGQVHTVEDDAKAAKLLEHKNVWVDGADETNIILLQPPKTVEAPPMIGFTTGNIAHPPIMRTIEPEVYEKLQKGDLVEVFMTPADFDQFSAWRLAGSSMAPRETGPAVDPNRERATLRLPQKGLEQAGKKTA